MLKLIIFGVLIASLSAAPLESTSLEKSSSDNHHVQSLLLRPSPINPDVRTDPKPPERIILDDTKSERDQRSTYDLPSLTSDDHKEHNEHIRSEKANNQHSHDQHLNAEAVKHHDNKENSDKRLEQKEDNHDHHEREADVKEHSNEDLKSKETFIQLIPSGKTTVVYPIKTNGKFSFETSHHIPNVDKSEGTFETSHHIPTHIEDERKKLVENQALKNVK